MVSRELLWRAWPSGCLEKRGASTIGGWLCAGRLRWIGPSNLSRGIDQDRAMSRGDMLPNVDPADPGTWAIVLAQLAERADLTTGVHEHGFTWSHDAEAGMWTLDYGGEQGLSFAIDTPEPAKALVLAHIEVFEAKFDLSRALHSHHAEQVSKTGRDVTPPWGHAGGEG